MWSGLHSLTSSVENKSSAENFFGQEFLFLQTDAAAGAAGGVAAAAAAALLPLLPLLRPP